MFFNLYQKDFLLQEGHFGLGMTILESLVSKYGGNLVYEYSDTYFETKVILLAKNKEKSDF